MSVSFVIPVIQGARLVVLHVLSLIKNSLYPLDKERDVQLAFNIHTDHCVSCILLSSIFSAAMIALTYLKHGATGMMALPIIASIVIQSVFLSGFIMPNCVLKKVLELGDEDKKHPLGLHQLKIRTWR